MEYGRRAVEYADRSGDGFTREVARSNQANAQHQAGRPEAADKLFREAERLQQKRQPKYPLLYALQGYRYCDLLLSQGQAAEAQRRGQQTLKWSTPRGLLLDIALDHLTLGRTALALGDLSEAAERLTQTVDGLRASGNTDDVTPQPARPRRAPPPPGPFRARPPRSARSREDRPPRRDALASHRLPPRERPPRPAPSPTPPPPASTSTKPANSSPQPATTAATPDLDEIAAQLAKA